MKKALLFVVLAMMLSITTAAFAADSYTIAFIAMDSMDQHWLKVKAGAEEATAELVAEGHDVKFVFDAPSTKVDAVVQASLVENQITNKADAIMVAPMDAEALVPAIEAVYDAGIPTILIDTLANTKKFQVIYQTDNGAAARTAAQELGKLLDGKGKIAIINAQAGSQTTMTRENEFRDELGTAFPDIEIVGVQYSDGDKQKALNYAEDFMISYPDLAGFYACNEGSTVGTGNAVDQAGKAGEVIVVGFDFSEEVKDLVDREVIQATMVQNPWTMGYEGIKAAWKLINGEKIADEEAFVVDTGVTVATKENLAEIK